MDSKYDRDELLIKNALNSVITPDFDILTGVEEKMKKRGSGRKAVVLSLVAVLVLATTVLAAQLLGSFERLEEIIGEDEAALLTPVEIMTVGEGINAMGIQAELVAIGVFGNIVDVYFTLEDTVSNRLDGGLYDGEEGGFSVQAYLHPRDFANFSVGVFSGSFGGLEIINEDENGKLTLHMRYIFGESMIGHELVFTITDIMFDISTVFPQDSGINLADFAFDADYVIFQCDNPSEWGLTGTAIFTSFGDNREFFNNKIRNEGIPVLAHNVLNMSAGLDDIGATVSNIGVIDNRLHIKIYNPYRRERRENGGYISNLFFRLFRGDATELADPEIWNDWMIWDRLVPLYLSISFTQEEDGSYSMDEFTFNSFEELIFDIDLNYLHEYTLMVQYISYREMRLDWEVVFDTDSNYRQLEKAVDVNIPVWEGVVTQVSLNPFGLLIMGQRFGTDAGLRDLSVYVNTTYGRITPAINRFSPLYRGFDFMETGGAPPRMMVSARYTFDGLIDLDSVLSVEINGEVIEFGGE